MQYNINTETQKITALSSGKIDKYNYFTGDEIVPTDSSIIIKDAKFSYWPLQKVLKNQRKTIEDQERKQVKARKF